MFYGCNKYWINLNFVSMNESCVTTKIRTVLIMICTRNCLPEFDFSCIFLLAHKIFVS